MSFARSLLRELRIFCVLALVAAAITACVMMQGCQTIEAVTAAPEEFWITLDAILYAVWQDVLTLVEIIL